MPAFYHRAGTGRSSGENEEGKEQEYLAVVVTIGDRVSRILLLLVKLVSGSYFGATTPDCPVALAARSTG